jgi:hypothetical protein
MDIISAYHIISVCVTINFTCVLPCFTVSYQIKMDPSVACLIAQIRHADHQFKKAISQLTLLNNKISSTRCRYNRARREDRKTFAQNTSLQLTTYEGVCKM